MLRKVILLLLVLVLLALVGGFTANSFQRKPIINLISNPTAYTLKRGECQISTSPLSIPLLLASTRIDCGMTDNLQFGSFAAANFVLFFNVQGKYRVIHLPASQIDVAISASAATLAGTATILTGGGTISWGLRSKLGIHLGMNMATASFNIGTLTAAGAGISFFFGMDFDILPNTKLLGEIRLASNAIGVGTGILIRLWDALGIKAVVSLSPLSLVGVISFRY